MFFLNIVFQRGLFVKYCPEYVINIFRLFPSLVSRETFAHIPCYPPYRLSPHGNEKRKS